MLARKKRVSPPTTPFFYGEAQAKLIALACSEPPEGQARWTNRLLSEHVVERRIVPKAHFNTVARALKKLWLVLRSGEALTLPALFSLK